MREVRRRIPLGYGSWWRREEADGQSASAIVSSQSVGRLKRVTSGHFVRSAPRDDAVVGRAQSVPGWGKADATTGGAPFVAGAPPPWAQAAARFGRCSFIYSRVWTFGAVKILWPARAGGRLRFRRRWASMAAVSCRPATPSTSQTNVYRTTSAISRDRQNVPLLHPSVCLAFAPPVIPCMTTYHDTKNLERWLPRQCRAMQNTKSQNCSQTCQKEQVL